MPPRTPKTWSDDEIDLEVKQDAGQYLADLVMEVAGDAYPLGFLRRQDAPAALLTLGLEPVEHSIEGDDDAADLVVAEDLQALTGAEEVDRLHSLRQALERRERTSQQDHVRGQRHRQPRDHDQRLYRPDRSIDLHRSEQEQRSENAEKPGVDGEDTPEERKRMLHPPDVSAGLRSCGHFPRATGLRRRDQDRHRRFTGELLTEATFEAAPQAAP